MLIAQKNVLLAGLLVISSVRIAKGAPAAEDPEEEVLSACQLPKDVGDCDKNVTKYYFNSESEECEEFTFGGCNGNDNKFDSMEECSEACKKDSEDENKSNAYRMGFDPEEDYDRKEGFLGDPQDPRFRDLRPYRPAPFYYRENSDERLGLGFYGYPKPYGHIGHPQHRNNFEEFEPENKWGLLNYFAGYPYGGNNNLLVEDKRRQAALGYNRGPEDNDKKFSYNGFSGFNPEALSKPVISVCSQPRKSGRCFNNSFQRFYYDSRLGKCIRFSYNGCGGNQNNFETYNDCVQTCARLFYKSKKIWAFTEIQKTINTDIMEGVAKSMVLVHPDFLVEIN
uniref:Tissue factor pathway inhibitor n=1 Tax=Lepeophtheirus salmonis TaxID=72036 RepID=C1BU55_LEPSM|nr:Tissue factor pathway inhibitor precursor [Lepeophtheirus salmonis]